MTTAQRVPVSSRRITVKDLPTYARPGCRTCNGAGFVVRKPIGATEKTPGTVLRCHCLEKQFARQGLELVFIDKVAWLVETVVAAACPCAMREYDPATGGFTRDGHHPQCATLTPKEAPP